jgi:manganese transport protein
LTIPSLPPQSLTTVIGLIGTTVVPYNLFLHASSVQEKWPKSVSLERSLGESRLDTSLAVGLGGVITLAIVTTAAAAFYGKSPVEDPALMAAQLEPLLGGPAAKVLFAVGLFAAGTTSTITAPLAAAYAASGALGWRQDLKAWTFRSVWFAVLLVGTVLAALGWKSPAETILIAQVANGLLLPSVAVFLLIAANRTDLMGQYKNGPVANVVGGVVVLVAAGLGAYSIASNLLAT